ncbi:MAG: proline--tRNA ligase [Candidatus Omnitrophota bacterium]
MRWSRAFIPTLKEDPQDAEAISHKLMVRAGLIRRLTAGAYTYLPMGYKILRKVEDIIREEMNAAGASELLMPALQPMELWQKTGRDADMGEVMIRYKDRHGKLTALGPTHEEVITDLVSREVRSYKDLPIILYQIQTKFRDEIRPRFGVMRSCEFIMKDAYSFDVTPGAMEENYKKMYDAYCRIFERCGLSYLAVEADPGLMGGTVSHEFMVPSSIGEDEVLKCNKCAYVVSMEIVKKRIDWDGRCPKCGAAKAEIINTIEIGHTFKLGAKYSKLLNASFLDEKGKENFIIMGCYGIGVNRILAALIETSHDADGIIWPKSISPYEIVVIPIRSDNKAVQTEAERIYKELLEQGIDVLIDDRDKSPGMKFKDADLIGFPLKIIIGQKNLENNKIEIKERSSKTALLIDLEAVLETIEGILAQKSR